MIQYLLDTNICIYIIKRKPIQVINKLQSLNISEVGISSITLSELEYGVAKSSRPDQNKVALAEFLSPVEILPYDDNAAEEYGKVRSTLESMGTPIGSLDMLIAAHSLALDCILVTNNEKEFLRVPDLHVENWV
jgi:tRNA(fMet)-specific endonuclease VapC